MTTVRVLTAIDRKPIGEVTERGGQLSGDAEVVRIVAGTMRRLRTATVHELNGWSNGYITLEVVNG